MSVRFSCAVCCAFFRVPVCNTVLEYSSECRFIWDSGLCRVEWLWLTLSDFFGENRRKDMTMGYQAFYIWWVLSSFWTGSWELFWPGHSHWFHLRGKFLSVSWVTSRWPVWTLLLGNETSCRCHLSICISSQSPLQALEFCFWRWVIEVFNPLWEWIGSGV